MESADGGTPRPDILVVHCQETMCHLVRDVLTFEGYRVHEAVLGHRAARVMRQAAPGLIVLLEPIVLHVAGRDEFRAVVDDTAQRARHVIVCWTTQCNAEIYSGRMHADCCLTVPFTCEELLAVIEEARRISQTKQRVIH